MIDKRRSGFLQFGHFAVPGAEGPIGLSAILVSALATLWLCGCSPRSAPHREEDSLTSGRIKVVCAPEAERLIARERAAFEALYPQSHIELQEGSSSEGVRALFAAECDLAVISRELDVEERAAAVRGRLELEGYRFARDAIVAVANPGSTVENVSLEDLRKIYAGSYTSWSQLGGRAVPIEPVIQPMQSDVTTFFLDQVMGGTPIQARVLTEPSDSLVVERVRSTPAAVGYVSMAWGGHGAKTLRVASMTGLPYLVPDPEAVYKGTYPLTRFFNLYVRSDGSRLANGFITYITSRDGQALVYDSGLVPTSVPVRFVRRSPMVSTHQ
ncbi:MAG TPA: substrate-binding domain-containing protein [Candidatus Eisenbacteria bacterium]